MIAVRTVSFAVALLVCCTGCLTIFVLGIETVRVTALVFGLAIFFANLDTNTVTRKLSIPKTKIIKQPVQQPRKSAANDAARTAIKPTIPQKPLPNQQTS